MTDHESNDTPLSTLRPSDLLKIAAEATTLIESRLEELEALDLDTTAAILQVALDAIDRIDPPPSALEKTMELLGPLIPSFVDAMTSRSAVADGPPGWIERGLCGCGRPVVVGSDRCIWCIAYPPRRRRPDRGVVGGSGATYSTLDPRTIVR